LSQKSASCTQTALETSSDMSSFSFQFDVDVGPELRQQVIPLKHDTVKQNCSITNSIKKECFEVPCPHYEEGDNSSFSTHHIGDFAFKKALLDRSVEQEGASSILLHDKEDHDLIPGRYEGGFKIWECSYDLAEILIKSTNLLSHKTKRILELGCGHGVPGIIASKILDDTTEIVFADFNSEVLEMTTWPNILLNCTPETIQKVRCIAGDWSLLSAVIGKFDLILSAETLYSAGSCQQVS
jgi:Lysine methyltransferase